MRVVLRDSFIHPGPAIVPALSFVSRMVNVKGSQTISFLLTLQAKPCSGPTRTTLQGSYSFDLIKFHDFP